MELKAQLDKIEPLILGGNYPFFCLRNANGEDLVPCRRPDKSGGVFRKHWALIRHKIEVELPAGKYFVHCYFNQQKSTECDYPVVKTEQDVLNENANPTPIVMDLPKAETIKDKKMDAMTLEEYKRLITENERLKSEKALLMTELEMSRQKCLELEAELSDMEEGLGEDDGLTGGLASLVPTGLQLLDEYFKRKDRELDLMERSLNSNAPQRGLKPFRSNRPLPSGKVVPMQRNAQNRQPQESANQADVLIQYFNHLFDTNEEQANAELDQLEKENPEAYQMVSQALGLEDDFEEQGEEGQDNG